MKVDVDSLCTVLSKLYDRKSSDALRERMAEAVEKGAKFSFADAKKEFLKGAASGLGKGISAGAIATLIGSI